MKLKPHSIRFKFFSAISLVALMFIGILLLLNLFFYQDYFMMTRKSSLCDAFDTEYRATPTAKERRETSGLM